ncbi:MAG TPA: VRR-NUC domain-containing protein [Vicinamibacterales bacterium]
MSDRAFLNQILLACSTGPVRLFRQSVGLGWIGKSWRAPSRQTVTVEPGDVVIRQARPFKVGVEGMADLGGWRTVEITPDMVGSRIAQVVQLEGKQGTDRLSAEQRRWLETVTQAGGLAAEIRAVDDAKIALMLR